MAIRPPSEHVAELDPSTRAENGPPVDPGSQSRHTHGAHNADYRRRKKLPPSDLSETDEDRHGERGRRRQIRKDP